MDEKEKGEETSRHTGSFFLRPLLWSAWKDECT